MYHIFNQHITLLNWVRGNSKAFVNQKSILLSGDAVPDLKDGFINTDFNTLTTTGVCAVTCTAGTNQTTLHAPFGEETTNYSTVTYYVVETISYSGGYRLGQIAISCFSHNPGMWYRQKHDITWGSWHRIDKHSADDITSGTLPVSRGGTGVTSLDALKSSLGIGSGGASTPNYNYSDIITGQLVVGGFVTMAGDTWLVCHIDDTERHCVYLCKYYIDESIQYAGAASGWTYATSIAAQKCSQYAASLPANVQNKLVNYNMYNFNCKIFLAEPTWLVKTLDPYSSSTNNGPGEFTYFTNNDKRIAYNRSGAIQYYWLATGTKTVNGAWNVHQNGYVYARTATGNVGFRPFCCLPW